jgi:hypothetical protein
MTEKRRKFSQWLLAALGAGLILLALAVAATSEPEPEYAGKTLSEWLEAANTERLELAQQQILESAFGGEVGTNSLGSAAQAIRTMGDQVLPNLLSRLQARETWLMRAQDRLAYYFDFVPATPGLEEQRQLARLGFEILGTNAWPALPQLSPLLGDTNCALLTTASLCAMGPPGMRAIHSALLDPEVSDAARAEIVFALTWAKDIDQTEMLPVVFGYLDSPVEFLRFNSVIYLMRVRGDPAVMVPRLVERLDHPEATIRGRVAAALGTYGTNAGTAIPKLEALLAQPDEPATAGTVHEFYRAALKSIRDGHQEQTLPEPSERRDASAVD